MGLALAYAVDRDGDVDLVDQMADGLGLHKAGAEAYDVDQVLAVDVVEIPGGFADASEGDENGAQSGQFEVGEVALFQVAVYAGLTCVESCGKSCEASVDAA